ncbi:telomerase subunit, putative [Candida dubliniensis CD36]|uniref:Telomere replication protein EST3 n=1 Tax=Candida dubliniensis (strain CD36 / ATCC MYA-646 / CBS 7987 / NCPF 3949 / NRRL Y-17841) TaxID=573826 RepID=B9WD20_CANDC|nr:telomerase subunit, putative [Candida dubliniensis CD36]CAX42569.1 telomerase subunit, putative [Candida dubliniensis CD36]
MQKSENDVPMIMQSSWLVNEVIKSINSNGQYINSLIKKDFQPTVLPVSFVLRILKFTATTDSKDITAVLADSTHKIFAIFLFSPAIVDFENKYHHRMTYNTRSSVIRIHKANLRFMDQSTVNKCYNMKTNGNLAIAVLEILEFDIFLKDQYSFITSIENRLKYVYEDTRYDQLCREKMHRPEYDDLMCDM